MFCSRLREPSFSLLFSTLFETILGTTKCSRTPFVEHFLFQGPLLGTFFVPGCGNLHFACCVPYFSRRSLEQKVFQDTFRGILFTVLHSNNWTELNWIERVPSIAFLLHIHCLMQNLARNVCTNMTIANATKTWRSTCSWRSLTWHRLKDTQDRPNIVSKKLKIKLRNCCSGWPDLPDFMKHSRRDASGRMKIQKGMQKS